MRCAACGADVIAGKRFCHACGTPVAVQCRGCGATIDPGFRFCPDCGLQQNEGVHDAVPPPASDAITWLSRHIPTGLAHKIRATRGAVADALQARIGINTGPVVVGNVGNDLKMDYTAIGDTTNLAARLQALAEPGSVLISETTYRLVRGFFEVRALGPLAIRGKADRVPGYEVVGRSELVTP